MIKDCTSKFSKLRQGARKVLPEKGTDPAKILEEVKTHSLESEKFYMGKGNISGSVYINEKEHWKFIGDVTSQCLLTNPLHIDEFMWIT